MRILCASLLTATVAAVVIGGPVDAARWRSVTTSGPETTPDDAQIVSLLRSNQKKKFDKELARGH